MLNTEDSDRDGKWGGEEEEEDEGDEAAGEVEGESVSLEEEEEPVKAEGNGWRARDDVAMVSLGHGR